MNDNRDMIFANLINEMYDEGHSCGEITFHLTQMIQDMSAIRSSGMNAPSMKVLP